MKLLELLVRELPKRGGWPYGAAKLHQDYDGEVWMHLIDDDVRLVFRLDQAATNARQPAKSLTKENIVTRLQYEAALQQPVWNGEGLPPVGCEFEYGTHRSKAKCIAVGHHFVFASAGNPDDEEGEYEEMMISILDSEFYPVRSERDKFAELLADKSIMGDDWQMQIVGLKIYDAIKAGKLGVKLSD